IEMSSQAHDLAANVRLVGAERSLGPPCSRGKYERGHGCNDNDRNTIHDSFLQMRARAERIAPPAVLNIGTGTESR
ncbi:MAG: hypothetical protein ABIS15_04555, partial [Gemmatimonadaceae bacterium]